MYALARTSFPIVLLMLIADAGLVNADWYLALCMTGPPMHFLESWNGLLYGLTLVAWCSV